MGWTLSRLLPKTASAEQAPVRPRRGVSLAGAEFGAEKEDFSNENPGVFGRDYTYNSERTFEYFRERGISLFRLPIRWERIQPRLGEPLDQQELERLRTAVTWARKHEAKLIIDIHNYGRYAFARNGRKFECVIDQPMRRGPSVTRREFADLWQRLSETFHDEPAVDAYGLMNEPHDMAGPDWKAISQAAVDAIRAGSDSKPILVAGDGWSNAARFAELNGRRAWIKDPVNHIAYEAHCYFDQDHSGHYRLDYAAELARDSRLDERGVERLQPFVRWCRANGVRGFLGEFGIPASDARWQSALARFLEALDSAGMDSCYWAAGEWWGTYPLSIQPAADFQRPAPPMHILTR
jgi:endoglucanase